MSWERLPLEIRVLIWDAMAERGMGTFGRIPKRTPMHPLAAYSTVCKEWRDIFERKIWRRLSLTQSSLPSLQWNLDVSPYRKSLIQDIHLRIELEQYTCDTCDTPSPQWIIQQRRDSKTVERAIYQLFSWLSAWDKPSITMTGLRVEISAVSPSDKRHAIQCDVYIDSEGFAEDQVEGQVKTARHVPYHGYTSGQWGDPSLDALHKIFRLGLFPKFQRKSLAQAAAVKTLLIRRQTRRLLGHEALLSIFRSLPQLETLVFEPWRAFDLFEHSSSKEYHVDNSKILHGYFVCGRFRNILTSFTGYCNIIMNSLPPTLRNLTLFEGFNEEFNWVFANHTVQAGSPASPELVRTPSSVVSYISAAKSISMTTLSASYLVDAQDFFSETVSESMADQTWEQLECLTLTTPLLRDESHADDVVAMLVDAGRTAQRMPKLSLMEIWYGMKRTACVFRYRVEDDVATISWQGTWSLSLTKPAVSETWQTVAETHTGRDVKISTVQDKPLDRELVKSHAHAVAQLGLGSKVAHPASLEEIRREADAYSSVSSIWSFRLFMFQSMFRAGAV